MDQEEEKNTRYNVFRPEVPPQENLKIPAKDPASQKAEYIFTVRKSYLDKIYNFEHQTHYGQLLLFGTIIITLITKADTLIKFLGITGYLTLLIGFFIFSYVFITIFKEWSCRYANKQHRELIRDIKNNDLDKLEKHSFWDYFNNRKG